jgi:hypothetical protein
MSAAFDSTTLTLFLLTVFPGLISITVYRLIMPARALEWGNGLLQGLFYSAVNFALGLPFLFLLVFGYDPLQHPVRYSIAALLLLLVLPVLWPFALVALFKSDQIARRIQIPYPTAWDFFFDRRESSFFLVHLNNGALLGGYYALIRTPDRIPMTVTSTWKRCTMSTKRDTLGNPSSTRVAYCYEKSNTPILNCSRFLNE